MHIAVCDDNVADRKQTERLLGRESESRIQTSGNLYVDSYGNVEALMHAPMKYDLFFIDMTENEPTGMEVARMLRTAGVTSPIVLLVSKIDYRAEKNIPENIYYLDKPVKKADLSDMLDKASELFLSKPQTIELRDETKTYYVLPDQIVYAVPEDHVMKIRLSDGKDIAMLGSRDDLCRILAAFDCFLLLSGKNIININHVCKIKKRIVTMSDNAVFKAGLTEWKSLLQTVSGRGSRFIPENLAD